MLCLWQIIQSMVVCDTAVTASVKNQHFTDLYNFQTTAKTCIKSLQRYKVHIWIFHNLFIIYTQHWLQWHTGLLMAGIPVMVNYALQMCITWPIWQNWFSHTQVIS